MKSWSLALMNCSGRAVPKWSLRLLFFLQARQLYWSPRSFLRLNSSASVSQECLSAFMFVPYIPWEMANRFPRAELSHEHHFQFTPEVMTSLPVTPEVRSWTGRDDRKWSRTSGSKIAILEVLVSFENHSIDPQNSLDIHFAAAQTAYVQWYKMLIFAVVARLLSAHHLHDHWRKSWPETYIPAGVALVSGGTGSK